MSNKDVIMHTLKDLSKKQAKICSEVIGKAADIPWHIFILIDSTIQGRSGLKSENVQRFNHGQGFVIGHQRTNILLIFNGIIIPLPPIPFYIRKNTAGKTD